MPWFKIDDGFHCHPKALAAGNAALGLWTRLGAYASDQLTDGFIPAAIAKGYGSRAELARLVDVRLIEPGDHTDYGAGYWLHDYHDYNPTADKVLADRAAAAERKRKSREDRDRESRSTSRRDTTDDERNERVTSGVEPAKKSPENARNLPQTTPKLAPVDNHEHAGQRTDRRKSHGVTHTTPTRPDPTRPDPSSTSRVSPRALSSTVRPARKGNSDTEPRKFGT